jgi:hypothetical protein
VAPESTDNPERASGTESTPRFERAETTESTIHPERAIQTESTRTPRGSPNIRGVPVFAPERQAHRPRGRGRGDQRRTSGNREARATLKYGQTYANNLPGVLVLNKY